MRDTIGSTRSSVDVISPLGIPSSTMVSTSIRALSFSESESDQLSWADILGSKGDDITRQHQYETQERERKGSGEHEW